MNDDHHPLCECKECDRWREQEAAKYRPKSIWPNRVGSNDMSEIEKGAWNAAETAFWAAPDNYYDDTYNSRLSRAIRAYEAHNFEQRSNDRLAPGTTALTRPAHKSLSGHPPAVPDDVAEMVRWIRSTLDWSPQAQAAADMLERYATGGSMAGGKDS